MSTRPRTTPSPAATIGGRVKSHRLALGLTGNTIQTRTVSMDLPHGIHPGSLCAIEKGRREPSLPQLRALARLFGVTLDALGGVGRRSIATDTHST